MWPSAGASDFLTPRSGPGPQSRQIAPKGRAFARPLSTGQQTCWPLNPGKKMMPNPRNYSFDRSLDLIARQHLRSQNTKIIVSLPGPRNSIIRQSVAYVPLTVPFPFSGPLGPNNQPTAFAPTPCQVDCWLGTCSETRPEQQCCIHPRPGPYGIADRRAAAVPRAGTSCTARNQHSSANPTLPVSILIPTAAVRIWGQ